MIHANGFPRTSLLRQLMELPGIDDVVWGTVTRLASKRAQTTVLFTATEMCAGTSVLASATAIGLLQHQRVPVCLLETNVRRPALARYLGLESAGLSDILDGRAELEDCLQQPRDCPDLFVLPAGTPRELASGEFTTERFTAILAELEQRCHYLVVDTAPLLESVESRMLLRHADGAVLVLRARETVRSDAEHAHDILVESGIPILGSIFNACRSEGLLGDHRRATRPVHAVERAERPVARVLPPVVPEEAGHNGNGQASTELRHLWTTTNGGPLTNGGPPSANGKPNLESPGPTEAGSEAAHRRQVEILERRIVKLTHLLEQTEADLRRTAAMKNGDLGIASNYRNVQGLLAEDETQAFKRSLMQEIFEANLELKTAMARRS